MKIQLVVLDMAGTTVHDDNNVYKAFQATFHQFGYTQVNDQDINQRMGYAKPQAIREILSLYEPDAASITNERVEQLHDAFRQEMLNFYRKSPSVKSMPGAEAAFENLTEMGLKIALNTGFSRDIAEVIVERLQWHSLLDYLIASDEVEKGRPSPLMIQKLMQMAAIDGSLHVAKVGDTEVDIMEGKAAGCAINIAVTTGAYGKEALLSYGPTHCADSLEEVVGIIQQYNKAAMPVS